VESQAYPVSLMKVNPDGLSVIQAQGHLEDFSDTNYNDIENSVNENTQLGENPMNNVVVENIQSEIVLKEPALEVEASICNIVFHVCTTCLQGFETEEGLTEHREKVHEETVVEDKTIHNCEICSESFDDYVDLCSHHFLKHHLDHDQQNQTVQVTGTGTGTGRKRKLDNDSIRSSNAKRPNMITQGRDPDSTLTESEMEAMFEFLVPSVQLNVNFSAWDHTCRFCHKSFLEYEPYRLHLRQHRIDSNISCPICGDEFDAMSEMYDHMKTHEQENSIKLRRSQPKFCDHCCCIFPDSFIKTRGCLIEGKEHSTVEMSHVCVFCMAACSCTMDFPTDGHLPIPYRCEFSRCYAVFQLESDMARHSYYNHDECHVCQYRIPTMQRDPKALRIEIYEDHLRVTHKCPKCGQVFKKQKDKTRHILEEHKQPKKKPIGRPSNRKCYSCGASFQKIEDKKIHVESYCPVLKKSSARLENQLEGLVLPEGSDVGVIPMTVPLKNKGGIVFPRKLYNQFVCLFCMNLVKTQLDFDVHKVTCKPILKCTSCEMNLRESEGYDFHTRSCKTCRTLSCVMCRKFTGEPEAAFNHARLCKKKSLFMMACCAKCKQRVPSYDAAQLHKCNITTKTKAEEQEVAEKMLKKKKNATILSVSMLETKAKPKPADLPGQYRCRFCNLNLPRKVSSHELYCTYNTDSNRRMIYGCDYCNIKYPTRDDRDVHLMTCLRGKCDFCHENFGNEGHRIMHMRGCHYKPKCSSL
jgi:uncharacterized C2H2 Zn-finger protein